ncbi:MAG: type II toxin-antitoxin system CcdA family antitoxin [Magnetococcales bacterium]|nr:type II toxin-antitoxin system CcdA family antitoxin [Magnetococcales bacterium]MBF0423891.1 type II toxin-antitoxin system CcdA family antitoxin [Magnetococcales bacterium]
MEHPIDNISAPKRPVNVRINGDLVAQAEALKINLSQELETHLATLVALKQRQTWKQENQEAIDSYNYRMEKDGPFGDGERIF